MMPLLKFVELLQRNRDQQLRQVHLSKDTYEQELVEIRQNQAERWGREQVKRKLKTIMNLNQLSFSPKEDKWLDTLTQDEKDFLQNHSWVKKLLSLLPYKQHTNLVIDPETLEKLYRD